MKSLSTGQVRLGTQWALDRPTRRTNCLVSVQARQCCPRIRAFLIRASPTLRWSLLDPRKKYHRPGRLFTLRAVGELNCRGLIWVGQTYMWQSESHLQEESHLFRDALSLCGICNKLNLHLYCFCIQFYIYFWLVSSFSETTIST